ncbi:CCR4-NOT transcription complex subunit 1 isoform X1, partial [Brachionus plicatilis]
MNLDNLSFSLSQIHYLVTNLNKKNFKASHTEIQHIIENHGFEAERHLFRCLLSSVDFNVEAIKSTGKDFHQSQLLREFLGAYLAKPNFSTILCYAIENPLQLQESVKFPSNLVGQISKLLKLSLLQEVSLAIYLLNLSKEDVRAASSDLLKQKIPEFFDSLNELVNDSEYNELQIGLLQQILIEVQRLTHQSPNSGQPNKTGNYSESVEKFFKDYNIPAIIRPFLTESKNFNSKISDKTIDLTFFKMENSLIGVIQEIGFSFTS